MSSPEPGARGLAHAERILLAALLLSALSTLLAWPGHLPLVEPDEGRYSDIPAAMARTGDWVTPRLDGVRYFEKPPMLYWLGAASIKLLGPTPAAARLPTHLASLATALLVFLGGRRFAGGRFAGLLAAAFYLSSLLAGPLARVVSIDVVLALGTTATFLVLAEGCRRAAAGGKLSRLEAVGLGLSLAVGTLAKGPVALVFGAAAVGLWWLVDRRRWRDLLAFRPFLSSAVALAVAAPWFVLVERRNPGFARFFFIHEHLERYTTTVHDRTEPPGTMLAVVLLGTLPWLVPAVAESVRSLFRRRSDAGPAPVDPARRLLLFAALFPVAFFSISKSQLPSYVLPSIAPLAILAAARVARLLEEDSAGFARRLAIAPLALGGLLLLLVAAGDRVPDGPIAAAGSMLALPAILWLTAGFVLLARSFASALRVALFALFSLAAIATVVPAGEVGLGERVSGSWSEDVARLAGDDTRVVCYLTYVWSLPFALGREVPVVKYRGELAYGMGWPDAGEVAWDEKRLREEWNSGRRVFVILKEKHLKNLLAEGIEPAWRRIDPGRSYMIVSNRPPATPATPAEGTP